VQATGCGAAPHGEPSDRRLVAIPCRRRMIAFHILAIGVLKRLCVAGEPRTLSPHGSADPSCWRMSCCRYVHDQYHAAYRAWILPRLSSGATERWAPRCADRLALHGQSAARIQNPARHYYVARLRSVTYMEELVLGCTREDNFKRRPSCGCSAARCWRHGNTDMT
jgi:hypothetical protein